MRQRRRRDVRPIVDYLDDRCLLSGSAGYTPAQITAAYGLNAITFQSSGTTVKGDGSGETIALIEMYHAPNLSSDLATLRPGVRLAHCEAHRRQPGGQPDGQWLGTGGVARRGVGACDRARGQHPGGGGRAGEHGHSGSQEPDDGREHGEHHTGRRGGLHELGFQRIRQ